jgi:hypothetical protein
VTSERGKQSSIISAESEGSSTSAMRVSGHSRTVSQFRFEIMPSRPSLQAWRRWHRRRRGSPHLAGRLPASPYCGARADYKGASCVLPEPLAHVLPLALDHVISHQYRLSLPLARAEALEVEGFVRPQQDCRRARRYRPAARTISGHSRQQVATRQRRAPSRRWLAEGCDIQIKALLRSLLMYRSLH